MKKAACRLVGKKKAPLDLGALEAVKGGERGRVLVRRELEGEPETVDLKSERVQ